MHDPIKNPSHYTAYPVQPIEISRHLGFCLGNALKYVLRAPFKNGVEDCDKALQYLQWEQEVPQPVISVTAWRIINDKFSTLSHHLRDLYRENGKRPQDEILWEQAIFLEMLAAHIGYPEEKDIAALLFRVEKLRGVIESLEKQNG